MYEELAKFLVSNLRFSFGCVEIDMPKDPVQARVRFFNGSEGFVQSASNVDLHVFQMAPSRIFRNEKVEVPCLVFSKGNGFFFGIAGSEVLCQSLVVFGLEFVGKTL